MLKIARLLLMMERSGAGCTTRVGPAWLEQAEMFALWELFLARSKGNIMYPLQGETILIFYSDEGTRQSPLAVIPGDIERRKSRRNIACSLYFFVGSNHWISQYARVSHEREEEDIGNHSTTTIFRQIGV